MQVNDPSRSGGAGDDRAVRPDREEPNGLPRWVKIVGIVLVVVALVVVTLMLIGIGGHTPLPHGGDAAGATTRAVTGSSLAVTTDRSRCHPAMEV